MKSPPRDRPVFSEADAEMLARKHWGLMATARELAGEFDRNFELTGDDSNRVVLKVARAGPEDVPLRVRQDAIERVARTASVLALPTARVSSVSSTVVEAAAPDGKPVEAVLVDWIDGCSLASFRPHDHELLRELGRGMGEVSVALAGFDHPSLRRAFDWDLRRGPDVVAAHSVRLGTGDGRALVDRHVGRWRRFDNSSLPLQTVHGDANDHNVLVALRAETPRLALIDFGDMGHSWRIADLAIAAAYALMDIPDPVGGLCEMVAGYAEKAPITEEEADALGLLMALRLCVSVSVSAARSAAEPEDAYLTISERPAWDLLARLDSVHPRLVSGRVRAACGMDPSPASSPVRAWLVENGRRSEPVLDPDARSGRLAVFDLSVGTAQFEPDSMAHPVEWQHAFDRRLEREGASFGIGRYLEPRLVYASGQFDAGPGGPERQRTVHLGVDLFAPAGTAVRSPFDAVVEFVANHRLPLDYGPTVILRHPARAGRPEFRTLYGHLHDDLEGRLVPGNAIAAGERFATLGDHTENGGWPPHLHFQIVCDLLDRADGDFPGVATPSESRVWEAICPDPNLILGLDAAVRYDPPDDDQLLARRRARLGRNLSLSYRRPLHIVRGRGAYLYDPAGRRYLDGVNNVAHVGHAHPRIAEATRRQAAILNTNTRYLHPVILDYAEALAGKLPAGLDVCFFVNSGSEANDLALRLARAATGRRGFIAVDGAYHGHLHDLIGISPYKFAGPGGKGRPDHVRIVRMPDPYRGEIREDRPASLSQRGSEPGIGERYAADLAAAALDLERAGYGAAAFITEAILSCGGQVVPPTGWLTAAAAHARAAGALYIADEVQTGFGRVGTHWWAFEAQGAVPDIVTLGKPIGNGFPLGAVVTTREIADAFANGMEYFNTYGGNPVACSVGLEVIRVIEDEGLVAHSLSVGDRLLRGLRELSGDYPLIGDVRGIGLFAGFELVRDPGARIPAAAEATRLVNRMRDLGVLLSTDGPDHNVIKVKPPLVISAEDVDEMLSKLHDVLGETYFQDT